MPSSLHVEPDQLYLASRAFWQANYRGLDQFFLVRAALVRLQMTWIGDHADDYFAEMKPLLQQLVQHNEELLTMALILSRQADLWAEADQRWSGFYREFQENHPGA
jgi:uncharacterized protein YukE